VFNMRSAKNHFPWLFFTAIHNAKPFQIIVSDEYN
jgi:hypothetical protein